MTNLFSRRVAALSLLALALAILTPALPGPAQANRADDTPLIIVMDLSGSMDDYDNAGTHKLQGAKDALTEVIRNQRVGTTLGIWTYPSDLNCGAGQWLSADGPIQLADPEEVVTQINQMSAEGGTPTGAALQAAVQDLRNRGYESGNILLVSDGESGCYEPPCEVAEELVASGFDLSVQALGFEISDAGRQELECISSATGGNYFEISDANELQEVLEQLTSPELQLDVTAPNTVMSGSPIRVEVTVTNPTAFDVFAVELSLAFSDLEADAAQPTTLPPIQLLGTLPPGESQTRSWLLSTGEEVAGTAYWQVMANSAQIRPVSQLGETKIDDGEIASLPRGAVVQEALDRGPLVIMGDSYAAGEGGGDYETVDGISAHCHRSPHALGQQLVGGTAINLACSGALAAHIRTPQEDKAPAQFEQLAALPAAPGLVLLSLGGNDIGFAQIIERCARTPDCSADTEFATALFTRINYLRLTLVSTYLDVYLGANSPEFLRARDGEIAPLLVVGYPQLLPAEQRAACGPFAANEVRLGNSVVASLNGAISAAVSTLQEAGHEVYFVDTTAESFLPDRTACDPLSSVHPLSEAALLSASTRQEILHPTAAGYRAMAGSLLEWSQSQSPLDDPARVPATGVITTSPSSDALSLAISPTTAPTLAAAPGSALTVTVSGLTAASAAVLEFGAQPVAVGSVFAGLDGAGSVLVYVPQHTPAGSHPLHVSGFDAEGNHFTAVATVTVEVPEPWWLLPALIAGGLALLSGGLLLFLNRRRPAAG